MALGIRNRPPKSRQLLRHRHRLLSLESKAVDSEADGSPKPSTKGEGGDTAERSPTEDGAEADAGFRVVERRVRKRVAHKLEVTVTWAPTIMTYEAFQQACETEKALEANDHAIRKLKDLRNRLEEYIFQIYDILDSDEYRPYFDPAQVEAFRNQLSDTELWLEDEGASADEKTLTARLEALQQFPGAGDGALARHRESKERMTATSAYFAAAETARASAHPEGRAGGPHSCGGARQASSASANGRSVADRAAGPRLGPTGLSGP